MKLTKQHIALLTKQDRKAQYELYKICFGYMMSISLRYQQEQQAAEDVVNRAFLKVLKAVETYDVSKPLNPWISRITVNENIDACRKTKRLRSLINFDSEMVNADSNLSNYEYNGAEQELEADQLREMITKLPSTTQQVFNLYVVEGYKHSEIADLIGITTGTSKWHLNNARKKLKVMIAVASELEKVIHYGK